ncbi:uncharacterized protein [Canis lupus baileyi]|uniref:uncharacterized protein LOC112645070 n=1 Tax=Canis lupus dingo TaxID=286419 RepID=UPI0003AE164B|nr:uncharacterized protein LOC102153921 isoform X1 [Canis lupus familiaris]XP_025279883.1 uncharacterized protein LOC112645070 [Canis lupus dingo]XP_038383973.1 uncharacterized protein LOC102153921 isoform X1 [Canis lupus familiaris]XP_038512070.1 uncharacterized protein LOC102153921 isoform X1 [Canis lupus familiaris]|eukprot:XP_005616313.1 uncharacterized protein LOC102153921 isoform X1 [Canis lupus familiaris]
MSQRPQPDHKSTQPNVLPAAPTNTQEETQGFQSIRHSRRVSIQEPLPIIHNRRVSIQEPLPTIHNRRVSIQEPLPIIHNRRVSIQEPLPTIHNRRVSIQESLIVTSHWASTHDTPSVINSRQVSIENAPATISGHQASIQGAPSVTYSRRFNTRDVPPIFQTPYINTQNSPSITHTPLSNMESVIYNSSRASSNDSWPTSWSPHLSIQGLTLPNQARVNVPPSITHSPTVSVKSVDSVIWTSQEIFKDSVNSSQFYQNPLDNIQSTQTSISTEMDSGGFQNKGRRRHSQLPLAWKLLHGAKKISRQMSLALTLAGMVIISLISLGQPWMHFQVPLTPPGHPDGSLTIHINTIFFMQCPDIYCIQEYDQNAYLLDFAWAFLILASIASFFLCIILINIIFFTSSNLRMLDFSNVIISILAGTSMVLGILFYLMQAHEFLQEGMTYRLGRSFYLAWISVFLFLMTGFFSYLNYMNFWSILALQAIWT